MDESKDLARVESRLDALGLKFDDMLRILGKVEPLLEDVPKLRDKVQALEVAAATQAAQLETLKSEAKERRLKELMGTLLTSGAVGGAVAGAQYFLGK